MVGQSLVTYKSQAYSGNYTKNRQKYQNIKEITIHHCAGNMSVESLGRLWKTVGRYGQSHYGINGKNIGQYVSENDIAWCNSNWEQNCRAVQIEVANSTADPTWEVQDNSLASLIKLVADIAKRNNLGKLIVGKTLTYHKLYSNTVCPGPYLMSKLKYIADEANKINNANNETNGELYFVQAGAYQKNKKQYADKYAKELKDKGIEVIVVYKEPYYRVQLGVFSVKENAYNYVDTLAKSGIQAIVNKV